MSSIRICRDDERTAILAIVNAAAEAYRGEMGDGPRREDLELSEDVFRAGGSAAKR